MDALPAALSTEPNRIVTSGGAVFGFAGWSGSGKTTLIEQLIPRLVQAGKIVSLIKHAHHEFDIDRPGKDSYRHRQAGSTEVLVSSAVRWALMHELRGEPELDLSAAVARLAPCDLVLVEGYKNAAIPKLEVHRPSVGKSLLYLGDPRIVALATDRSTVESGVLGHNLSLPVFALEDTDTIATFILSHVGSGRQRIDAATRRA